MTLTAHTYRVPADNVVDTVVGRRPSGIWNTTEHERTNGETSDHGGPSALDTVVKTGAAPTGNESANTDDGVTGLISAVRSQRF